MPLSASRAATFAAPRSLSLPFPQETRLAASLCALLLLGACGGGGGGDSPSPAGLSGRVVLPSETGLDADSPDFQRLYGPGIFNINALANTIVGVSEGTERIVANRFKASESAALEYVRFLFVTGNRYSAGTGGAIRISLMADDGSSRHLPDMSKVLASATVVPAINQNSTSSSNLLPQQISFSQAPSIQAGQFYHIVFQNIDPNPERNFISIDHAATISANGRPSRWLNSTDWSVEYASRSANSSGALEWRNLTQEGSNNGVALNYFSPIMELGYAGGRTQGVGDMESGSVVPERIHTISAQTSVRERFTPTSDRTISGLSVAASTPTGGAMIWRLRQGSTVLSSGRITQRSPNHNVMQMKRDPDGQTANDVHVTSMQWYDAELPANITLHAGQSYDLEFTPEGNSQWVMAPHRNGQYYDFKWPSAFTESRAQHQLDGRWINTYLWDRQRAARSNDGHNWPVVLHLAP